MEDKDQVIRDLHEKIAELARKQKGFQEEINRLQNAVFELDLKRVTDHPSSTPPPSVQPTSQPAPPVIQEVKAPAKEVFVVREVAQPKTTPPPSFPKKPTAWEEFIGTNLLNKVGIAILVIGIGFGVKYSIDHALLNPLTRIILGYLAGVALIVLAIRLKKAHENFSAVLLSGGMAVFYFITYAAYDFYDLIPQLMAFVLMVVFTAFTVFAATQYNLEVIGIIGLVGAYAVPFLLSDGSGRVVIMFSYMVIINTGILVLSFKKYWKRLYYTSFFFTWVIFGAWHLDRYFSDDHLLISLAFSSIYFLTFYITFLAYKLAKREQLHKVDIFFMLANSFVFYGFGYASIDNTTGGENFLGLFTLATAVIHFIASAIIFRQQSQHRDTFYLVAGMVLVFLTLAVPVQLEGHWVTIVWAGEAYLLFWIGRTKRFPTYEKMSYALMLLAFGSLLQDWTVMYSIDEYYPKELATLSFFLNIQFATSLLVAASFLALTLLHHRTKELSPWKENDGIAQLIGYALPALFALAVYGAFYLEIHYYWTKQYLLSTVSATNEYGSYEEHNNNLLSFRLLWLTNYSALFALAVAYVQIKLIRNRALMVVNIVMNALVLLVFLTAGLYELANLRGSYLHDQNNLYYVIGSSHLIIRYVSMLMVVPLLVINNYYFKEQWVTEQLRQAERVLMHTAILVLLSSELVHWLELAGVENTFKLGLSILWGAYALFLIVLGLKHDKKYLRVSAIALFTVTLIKLFVYDMADMSTIAKTIVMIILGILLLTSSFLYNKSRKSATDENR